MAELVDPDQLVGTAEIADRLNVAQSQTIHAWRRRHPDFPEPIARVSGTYLWRWPDVEAWARATGRLAGTAP